MPFAPSAQMQHVPYDFEDDEEDEDEDIDVRISGERRSLIFAVELAPSK